MMVPVFLTRFCLKNPVAVTLFYLLVGIVGLTALFAMGRSILPPIDLPAVSIAAPYPGASPTEMEQLIVEPAEDELAKIPGVERVFATAQNGMAQILVRFRYGTDLNADRANAQQAVDAARANMPPDLVPPVLSKDDPSKAPILDEGVTSAVLKPRELSTLIVRQIEPALRATAGVGSVLVSGDVSRQLTVVPRSASLNALGATSLDVYRAVAVSNNILPGGIFRSPVRQSFVGIRAAATSAGELAAIPVSVPGAGQVRLADLADVRDENADAAVETRVDNDRSIVLYVTQAQNAGAVRTIAAAARTFRLLAQRYPLVRFEMLRSDAPYTSAAIGGVLQTLGESIALTVLVMLLFLRAWRNAAIAAIAIPASLCAAFAVMWALGFTINVLSLMGLSLTIGILVDDSIVIIEAIERAVQRGLKRHEAALEGRRELGAAALAITLVDVAVFAPIGLMSGIVGEFMREFALVIVIATAFSLLVSFTLTPLLAASWAWTRANARRPRQLPWMLREEFVRRIFSSARGVLDAFSRLEVIVTDRYANDWLRSALRNRRFVLGAALVACAASMLPLMLGTIPAEFSPPVDRGESKVDVALPSGTSLEQTDRKLRPITERLLNDPRVAHVVVTAGRGFNGVADVLAPNLARIGVLLTDPNAPGDDLVKRIKAMSALVPEATLQGSATGMGGTAPISYSVSGRSQVLDEAADRIARALRSQPFATDVRTSNGGVGPRLQITLASSRSALLRISPSDAAQTARIATGGSIASKVRLPEGLVNVVVRGDAAERGDLDALRFVTVRSDASQLVPLADLARIEPQVEPVVLERENGRRVVTVTANPLNAAPIGVVTSPMAAKLRAPDFLPAGVRVEPRGDVEQFLDTVAKIFTALLLSIVVVYVVLALLYKSYALPLVIMVSVPLASVGAFGSLYVLNVLHGAFPSVRLFAGQSLNLYSMLGIVMLVGLVAKNGILLIEYAERGRRLGLEATASVCRAAAVRFRPIVMTTFAMIAGMLPLALGQTIGAEYRKALGSVVIGGLSSSLLLTLFVVPVLYVACFRRKAEPVRDRAVAMNGARVVAGHTGS